MPTLPGSRVRSNNAYGTTTDNPLGAGATSFNSAALILLPAITAAAQHAVIVLDPKRVVGEPEIVLVTAHTGLSTTATITRAAYGTIARSHPVATAWAHVTVSEDYIPILTSTTRPSDPYLGQSIFETDTFSHRHFNGTGWQSAPPIGSLLPYLGSTAPIGYLMANGATPSRTGVTAALFAVIGTTYGVGDNSTTFTLPDLQGRVPVGFNALQSEFDLLGEIGGSRTVALTQNQLAQHSHTITDGLHNHGQTNHTHTNGTHDHFVDDNNTGDHDHTSPDGNVFAVSIGGPQAARLAASPGDDGTSHGPYITFTSVDDAGAHNHDIDATPVSITIDGSFANIQSGLTGINGTNNTGLTEAHPNLQPYITINYIIKY